MDWQTVLRASVPLGAALLSVVALIASRRDRAEQSVAERALRRAAQSVRTMARARGSAAGLEAPATDAPRSKLARIARVAGAIGLVFLIAATALVFATSRPLADVEILSASVSPPPCPPELDCRSARVVSVTGTLAGVSKLRDESVYVLVKPASSSTWSVGGQAHPDENGDWKVDGVPVSGTDELTVDLRAVVAKRLESIREGAPARSERLPGSRIVRLSAEGLRSAAEQPAEANPPSP